MSGPRRRSSATLPVFYVSSPVRLPDRLGRNRRARQSRNLVNGKGATPGEISSSAPAGQLYYFTTDLGNWGIKGSTGSLNFASSKVKVAFLGNLLSREQLFRRARFRCAAASSSSGRFRHPSLFQTAQWQLRYCDRYTGPIESKQYRNPIAKFRVQPSRPLSLASATNGSLTARC